MHYRNLSEQGFGRLLLRTAAGILLVCSPFSPRIAQAQTGAAPKFEVASLKEGGSGLAISPRRKAGRLTWTTSLVAMLAYSHHLPPWRISGFERVNAIYTLDATLDPSATEDQVRLMLQSLLAERCKLVSHMDTKTVQGYALIVANKGPKLQTVNADGELPPMPDFLRGTPIDALAGRTMTMIQEPGLWATVGRGVSTEDLARELSQNLREYVWDQTGLTGKYYFGFKFLSLTDPHEEADAASIYSVLEHDLGLKLQRQKGSGTFLVIDHLEKPSEN